MSGLPCTASKGLGGVSVSGGMRSPRPAASNMAGAVAEKSLGGVADGMETHCAFSVQSSHRLRHEMG